jgi:hypothetical protein
LHHLPQVLLQGMDEKLPCIESGIHEIPFSKFHDDKVNQQHGSENQKHEFGHDACS